MLGGVFRWHPVVINKVVFHFLHFIRFSKFNSFQGGVTAESNEIEMECKTSEDTTFP